MRRKESAPSGSSRCPTGGKDRRWPWKLAKGGRTSFTEQFFSHLERLLPHAAPAADIVIGSREAAGSRRIGEPFRRRLMGRVFNVMTQLLATPGIADTQCGFKVFSAEAAQPLFSQQTLDGFAFDAEILFLARRRGFTVAEVGIDWRYRAESKVRPFRDGWRTLRDLLIIRWRWLTGRYQHAGRPTG